MGATDQHEHDRPREQAPPTRREDDDGEQHGGLHVEAENAEGVAPDGTRRGSSRKAGCGGRLGGSAPSRGRAAAHRERAHAAERTAPGRVITIRGRPIPAGADARRRCGVDPVAGITIVSAGKREQRLSIESDDRVEVAALERRVARAAREQRVAGEQQRRAGRPGTRSSPGCGRGCGSRASRRRPTSITSASSMKTS